MLFSSVSNKSDNIFVLFFEGMHWYCTKSSWNLRMDYIHKLLNFLYFLHLNLVLLIPQDGLFSITWVQFIMDTFFKYLLKVAKISRFLEHNALALQLNYLCTSGCLIVWRKKWEQCKLIWYIICRHLCIYHINIMYRHSN